MSESRGPRLFGSSLAESCCESARDTNGEDHNSQDGSILGAAPSRHGNEQLGSLPGESCPPASAQSAVQLTCLEQASMKNKKSRLGKVCLQAVLQQEHPS